MRSRWAFAAEIACVVVAAGALSACHGARSDASRNPAPAEVPFPALEGKVVVFGRVVPDSALVEGAVFTVGNRLGVVADLPAKRSETHHEAFVASQRLYGQRRFAEAAAVLETALTDEPSNPFLSNEYARALFWVSELRPGAFEVYRALIRALDEYWRAQYALPVPEEALIALKVPPPRDSEDIVVIDMWFLEAYWKIASLYLDMEEWEPAVFEISRFLAGIGTGGDPVVMEQAFAFLAEAYHGLGDVELADRFARKALALNPGNDYVAPYLR